MNPIPVLLAAFGIGLAAAAAADHAAEVGKPGDVTPLFDCSYINFAYGFVMSGWYVDADGGIYRYAHDSKGRWMPESVTEAGVGYRMQADLERQYAARERIGSVDDAVLQAMAGRIPAAAGGKVGHADGGARDAGSSSCTAYLADPGKARYRKVELGSLPGANDGVTSNTSADANALLEWLRSLRRKQSTD